MNSETSIEFNQDLLLLYACHKTQLELKNRALQELYILLEFYIITVTLYEFVNANDIRNHLSEEDWKFLKKWRMRFLKKHALPGSTTIATIAQEMQIDFDHYFIESFVTVDTENDELIGINFGTHDFQIINDDDWRIFNELIITIIMGVERNYDRDTIDKIESFCKLYAREIEKQMPVKNYCYASGVMFKSPELCKDDKYLIMYYYTYMKLVAYADFLIPPLGYGDDNAINKAFRVSAMKMKAAMIESFGTCIKEPKTPLSKAIYIRVNDHVDQNAFSQNRRLRDNIHYKYHNDFSPEELDLIDKFQRKYFQIVFMSFDEQLKIRIDRKYKAVMWIADHTDTERRKARRKSRRDKRTKVQ